MATVLIVPRGTEEVLAEAWETEGREGAYIDYLTDDLGGFLESVNERISKGEAES